MHAPAVGGQLKSDVFSEPVGARLIMPVCAGRGSNTVVGPRFLQFIVSRTSPITMNEKTVSDAIKIALIVAVTVVTCEAIWIYNSPFQTCLRANPDYKYQTNWCTRANSGGDM